MDLIAMVLRLRRHAGCLAGGTVAGDSWLERCLVPLLARDAPTLERGLRLLYAAAACRAPARGDAPSVLARPFLTLSVEDRGLILLRQVEALGAGAVARILGLPPDEIGVRERAAWRRLEAAAQRHPARILIVEPDAVIGMEIAALTREMGHVPLRHAPEGARPLPVADMVVLDIDQRPSLSPLGWHRRLGLPVGMPMLLLSARRGALAAGREAMAALAKPFVPEALQRAILGTLATCPAR